MAVYIVTLSWTEVNSDVVITCKLNNLLCVYDKIIFWPAWEEKILKCSFKIAMELRILEEVRMERWNRSATCNEPIERIEKYKYILFEFSSICNLDSIIKFGLRISEYKLELYISYFGWISCFWSIKFLYNFFFIIFLIIWHAKVIPHEEIENCISIIWSICLFDQWVK